MRVLVAEAQASMRTPYKLFGSRGGVIRAILSNDQAVCASRIADMPTKDPLERMFEGVELVIGFYSDNQPFYRALFGAGHERFADNPGERFGEKWLSFSALCQQAFDEGHIETDVNPLLLSDFLIDNFTSNLSAWARGSSSIELAGLKIKLGIALILTGVTTLPRRHRMRAKINDYQNAIYVF